MTNKPTTPSRSQVCVGVDNKLHICNPESKTCKCGVVVKRKKLMRDDYKLFSCYECTY